MRKTIRLWIYYSPILLTASLGLLDIISAAAGPSPRRGRLIAVLFSHSITTASRGFVLVAGFVLLILTQGLLRRIRIAWQAALVLTIFSIIGHIGKGFGFFGAGYSLLVLAALLYSHSFYQRKSDRPTQRRGIMLAGVWFLALLIYGTLTIHLLGRHGFGLHSSWETAFIASFHLLLFFADDAVHARSALADLFLDSYYLAASFSWVILASSFLLPVLERLHNLPSEHVAATRLVSQYGKSSLDIFKLYWDKSYFFSSDGQAFLSYRLVEPTALVLGNPVGKNPSVVLLVSEFMQHANRRGWRVAFQQVEEDKNGVQPTHSLHRLKIGEEALIFLPEFSLEGRVMKDLRSSGRRLLKDGYTVCQYQAPLDDVLVRDLQSISKEWLTLPSRVERIFAQGIFNPAEIRQTPVAVLESNGGRLAFISLNVGYAPQCLAVDLLRRRVSIPNGGVDALICETALAYQARGFTHFSLGLAPLAGLDQLEQPSLSERALKLFYENVDSLFSYQGLREFKAKFQPMWEPRYLLYQRNYQLPSIGLALLRASQLPATLTLWARVRGQVAGWVRPRAQ